MQQSNQPQSGSGEYSNLAAIQRYLERLDERLDERTRDLVTRKDLEAFRKEVVTRDLMESQLSLVRAELTRLQVDQVNDRKELDERLKESKTEQTTRSERLWQRLSPLIAALALLLTVIEFLAAHVHFTP